MPFDVHAMLAHVENQLGGKLQGFYADLVPAVLSAVDARLSHVSGSPNIGGPTPADLRKHITDEIGKVEQALRDEMQSLLAGGLKDLEASLTRLKAPQS